MADKNSDKKADLLATITNHLVTVYALEPEQVEEMLHLSAIGLTETLEQAEHALADNDMEVLSVAAHKAKGILLGVGLKKEAELAGLIETNAREEKEAAYPQMLTRLLDSIQPLLIEQTGSFET
jgi:HPt (histidine-containing phosphotransfer) domain-containing protein